jgi:hypothetical protein
VATWGGLRIYGDAWGMRDAVVHSGGGGSFGRRWWSCLLLRARCGRSRRRSAGGRRASGATSDAEACVKLQDHLYDYVAPSAPWVPVGDSARVAGIALALLSLGLTLLPWLWVPRRPLVCLTAAVPALAVLLIGVLTWNAGLSGETAAVSGVVPAFLVWTLGLPVALALAASTRGIENTPQRAT